MATASPSRGALEQPAIDLSVVIPCRNGSGTLRKQLDALVSQETSARFEIVVSDNGSTDDSREIAESYADKGHAVRIADASRAAGINVARNEGVRAAEGTVILLCDADDVAHPGWIEAYWRQFQIGATCVGGSMLKATPEGSFISIRSELRRLRDQGYPYAAGANCGFTREVFDRIGGFDEAFAGGADEIDFFWRAGHAGYTMDLAANAVMTYVQRGRLCDVFKQYFRYGRGEVKLLRKHSNLSEVTRPTFSVALVAAASSLLRLLGSAAFRTKRRDAVERFAGALGVVSATMGRR